MPKKIIFLILLLLLFGGAVFSQFPNLSLHSSDVRIEPFHSQNGFIGYILVIRKRPGVESVMLTDSSGNYALRAQSWNIINGNERRELSGRQINDANSRYSILSSTPINDWQFGPSFQLFLPFTVVYGNPSSPGGARTINIMQDIQFNIRTFDRKYADPNFSKYQNNTIWLTYPAGIRK